MYEMGALTLFIPNTSTYFLSLSRGWSKCKSFTVVLHFFLAYSYHHYTWCAFCSFFYSALFLLPYLILYVLFFCFLFPFSLFSCLPLGRLSRLLYPLLLTVGLMSLTFPHSLGQFIAGHLTTHHQVSLIAVWGQTKPLSHKYLYLHPRFVGWTFSLYIWVCHTSLRQGAAGWRKPYNLTEGRMKINLQV